MFRTCGPNKVMVVYGYGYDEPRYISGGRVWVWPFIQGVKKLSLNTMTLQVESQDVYSEKGVEISVTGIAQVKVEGGNEDMLRNACQLFLGKRHTEVESIARETLEGHQRAIIGNMTVEEIIMDRQKFAQAVFEVASTDLINMGLTIVSYTIKDVRDQQGYLHALGMSRTAQVQRDARIGEAEANRDSGIKKANAEEVRLASKFQNDIQIAEAERDFQLKKTTYDKEINTKKATSELAYDLQAAKIRQRITEEEMQIKVVERAQNIQLQEQEIERKERALEATIRKPADAEKYRMEKIAEANKIRTVLESEAAAEQIRLKGEAEAFAITQKAAAEAEQMRKKAEAWEQYGEAAKIDMILDCLPKVAAEVTAPLTNMKRVTIISTGGQPIGIAKLTDEVIEVMGKMPNALETMTGIDAAAMMKVEMQK